MTSPENPTGPVHPVWGPPPAPVWGAPPPPPSGPPAGTSTWGPPAGPGGVQPPRKRRLTWVWFLIPVLIVFLASSTVVGVFGVKLYEQPIDATNRYYAAIRAGRYEDAFRQLCATRRFATTVSAFAATEQRANDARPITAYDFIGLDFPKDANSEIDIITTGTVTRNGFDHDTRVGLVREDDEWRVCTIEED